MKRAKESVDYSKGHAGAHCGPTYPADTHYCTHFLPSAQSRIGTCERVEGDINPQFWCRLFHRIKK